MEILSIELPSGKRKVLRAGQRKTGDPFHAFLSPDGTRLVFDNDLPMPDTVDELRMMRPDGSGERVIVKALAMNDVLWSPDGALLLVPGRDGTKSGYLVDPDSNRYWAWHACNLERAPRFLRWAADGRGIFAWPRLKSLIRCDFDGTVKQVGEIPGDNATEALAVSPDEKSVLFPGRRKLSVCDLSGASPREVLAAAEVDDRMVFWSPDSKWIGGFAQFKETEIPEVPEIVLKNLATGEVRKLGQQHTLGLQWWAPAPRAAVDTRAIVRAALGEGTAFSPPLVIEESAK